MAKKTLFILNDPPYGTERSYNALRLAGALGKREGEEIKLFLLGDAALCAKAGQKTPNGYYNIEKMLKVVARQGGQIGVCGNCMDARGLNEPELAEDCFKSSLDELADWTQWADNTLIF
ncbi:Protein YchN [hydrothermal vent metagenome]|uniref:Protein YchN n=1 Tax=hydrothermal vent metagenome TaxID=652676 RepID=A0A3B1C6I9_9ZZZZ